MRHRAGGEAAEKSFSVRSVALRAGPRQCKELFLGLSGTYPFGTRYALRAVPGYYRPFLLGLESAFG